MAKVYDVVNCPIVDNIVLTVSVVDKITVTKCWSTCRLRPVQLCGVAHS